MYPSDRACEAAINNLVLSFLYDADELSLKRPNSPAVAATLALLFLFVVVIMLIAPLNAPGPYTRAPGPCRISIRSIDSRSIGMF